MDEIMKRKAWDYAIGMNKIDGLEPSDELKKLIEKEISGEIFDDGILKVLNSKYKKFGE